MLNRIRPREGSQIVLLGYARPLAWSWKADAGLSVELPKELQEETRRPCRQAYAFRIEGAAVAP